MAAPADADEVRLAHDDAYVRALEEFAKAGGGSLDPDTIVAPGSYDAALLAAGCGLTAVDALRAGHADAAFVISASAGASHDRAAWAGVLPAEQRRRSPRRVSPPPARRCWSLDWDVHHGNGTQDIFWDEPNVLYVSTHEYPAYPGTGKASETGGYGAPGLTVNFPLPAGATGDVAFAALDDVVDPVVARFAPTWVLISAGFDAHRADPLADLMWTAGDYAELTRRVASYTPATGRVVTFLEGGYDLDALRTSVTATVCALAGEVVTLEPRSSGGPGRDQVAMTASRRCARRRASRDDAMGEPVNIRRIVVGTDGSDRPRAAPSPGPRRSRLHAVPKSSPCTASVCCSTRLPPTSSPRNPTATRSAPCSTASGPRRSATRASSTAASCATAAR